MPLRTCVGCRSIRPQAELVRCARAEDGDIVISRTLPGRGAWLCHDQPACLQQAIKRRGFERAFKRSVPLSSLNKLQIAFEAITTNMRN